MRFVPLAVVMLATAILVTVMSATALIARASDRAADLAEVLALGKLTAAPIFHEAEGLAAEEGQRPLYFEGLAYRGRPTRVFAWLGLPPGATSKVPGIVLVHGGGGTAFKEWVRRWNAEGFAALAIAVDGQTDRRKTGGERGDNWLPHPWAGPARQGIYGDSAEALTDQWMYHAVADTVLAHSILSSLPEVNAKQIGVMGISWGGVVAATTIGIDPRFAFAIPTYGCGHLDEACDRYGRALAGNLVYREVWEPGLRFSRAALPVLWFTWLYDEVTPLTAQSACYRAVPGPRMVAVLPDMKHGHAFAWTPPDSYAFAKSVVATGQPWARMVAQDHGANQARVEFESAKRIDSAVLWHTTDTGFTGSRHWLSTPAQLESSGARVRVSGPLPPETRAYFFNLAAGGLTLSSDFAETPSR